MIRLGGAAILATTAWAVLLAGLPSGVAWLCGANGLVSSVAPWELSRLGTLGLMWAVMMAAMVLPCVAVGMVLRLKPSPAQPSLLLLVPLAALLHWSLESTALLGTPIIAILLVAVLFTIELRKWTGPASPILPAIQMVALQLLADPMSVSWMAVVLLWMLADLLLPERATILSGIQRLGDRVNCVLAGFGLSRSH